MPSVSLKDFSNTGWRRGRSAIVEAIWIVVSAIIVSSPIPGAFHRRVALRIFGARIGGGVVIKPGVKIKFPWRLEIGDDTWIGERVWIDNLALVKIGRNACLSQDAYLCTGSHDWSSKAFDLIVKPIEVCDSAWITARSVVGPGVKIGEGAVLGLGSTTSSDLVPWKVYSGNPAQPIRDRIIKCA